MTTEYTEPVQVHPTAELVTPAGEHVQVDTGMVDLVTALWRKGFTTLQCCQDVGAGIAGGGCMYPVERRERYAAYWDGFAWLKMLTGHMERLMDLAAPIVAGNGWEATVPILSGRLVGFANLRYPSWQTAELVGLVEAASRNDPESENGSA
ncbi:hypothetical protein J4573_31465 [Actinomadura barringtoniae]|uniref:Uncharacterized protein n=1 Tax=Actinomadura barringtoniae TaxID=1427535 RepID=A0A939PFF3_9ACTN|nr:hypothetical protein [Actinomadura barringtoniae]MBO2451646.1 hypothetical protein [Actinomadura barringtoniae]